MSHPSWFRPGLAAASLALALSACATVPEPGPVARDETGVVVAVRPIVLGAVDLSTPIASGFVPATQSPGAAANPAPEPTVRVLVVADTVQADETQRGVSYTIRRDRDGTLFEVSQPETQALAQGTRVRIAYGARTRIGPVS